MKIKKIILQNFRRYQNRTEINFSDLTAFVGKNDAGKSTILEALDIFFGGGTIKPESTDASVRGNANNVLIAVIFSDLPRSITIDSGAESSLQNEYLLNSDGDLEIHKIYNMTTQTIKPPEIYAFANHPTGNEVENLLQKKNAELKAMIVQRGLEGQCNQRENPSMRQAIYSAAAELNLANMRVPLNEENGKAVWGAIEKYLPIYALFKSDRASSDQDPEVQNPMKLAIEKALSELETELDLIAEKVEEKAQETATRTIEQLRKSYPELASNLVPVFKKPSWKSIFKLDLDGDDGIPLNKKGSGVRRLVLLSFFQAEAERKKLERLSGNDNHDIPVIYAIEEPETSQHPDNQKNIIRALLDLAHHGDQVLLTTHVPELAGLIPLEFLRFVDQSPLDGSVQIKYGEENVYKEIAETLGILPFPLKPGDIKVAVCVEGVTDFLALKSFAKVLIAGSEIEELDFSKIFWVPAGGDGLQAWIEHRYLDSLGIPQIYIFDSDRTSAELPASRTKLNRAAELNTRSNCQVFITKKREIDNYVHPDAVERTSANSISLRTIQDIDFADISKMFEELMRAAITSGYVYTPTDYAGNAIPVGKRKVKHIITDFIMRNMTVEEIKARCAYNEGDITKYEIIEWLEVIRGHIQDVQITTPRAA